MWMVTPRVLTPRFWSGSLISGWELLPYSTLNFSISIPLTNLPPSFVVADVSFIGIEGVFPVFRIFITRVWGTV